MDEITKTELEELQKLPEVELDETQQIRLKELKSWAEAEKTAEVKTKDLESALAQKEHQRTKREEAEKAKIELEEKLKGGGNPTVVSQDPLEIVRLAKALSGYDETESELILKFAKDKSPESIIEATKNEWVQTAIQAKREKVAKEKQVPSPSSPRATVEKSVAEQTVKSGNVADEVAKKVAEMEAKRGGSGEI